MRSDCTTPPLPSPPPTLLASCEIAKPYQLPQTLRLTTADGNCRPIRHKFQPWGGWGGVYRMSTAQSTYFPRDETGLVCLPTQLERTLQLYWWCKCNERGWACTLPPYPATANFTLMTECTPESSGCNSVYSVVHSTHTDSRLLLYSPYFYPLPLLSSSFSLLFSRLLSSCLISSPPLLFVSFPPSSPYPSNPPPPLFPFLFSLLSFRSSYSGQGPPLIPWGGGPKTPTGVAFKNSFRGLPVHS